MISLICFAYHTLFKPQTVDDLPSNKFFARKRRVETTSILRCLHAPQPATTLRCLHARKLQEHHGACMLQPASAPRCLRVGCCVAFACRYSDSRVTISLQTLPNRYFFFRMDCINKNVSNFVQMHKIWEGASACLLMKRPTIDGGD